MRFVRAIVGVASLGGLSAIVACSLLLSYDDYDREWDASSGAVDGGPDGSGDAGDGAVEDGGSDATADACAVPGPPACDADLQASADNCGLCGHRCLPVTAKCNATICEVDTAFAYPFVAPQGVAVDDKYFYGVARINGVSDGGAARIRKDNVFAVDTFAVYTQDPRRVVAHGLDVYWTEQRGIARAPSNPLPDGGARPAELIVSGQAAPFAIAIDDTYVYWTNSPAGGDVWRASIATPADAKPIAAAQNAYGVAVDGAHVYWTSSVQGGAVWRANKDGTSAVKIADGQSYPAGLFVDADAIYWTNKSLSGAVMAHRFADADGDAPRVLAANRSQPDAIAARGGYVYWAESGSTQQDILRVSSCGGPPLRLAVQQTVTDLAVDDTHVYWATGATLLRVAR